MSSATPEDDNILLLQAVAQSDEQAFARLYDRLSGPLFSLVVRILRSRAEAEEVLQETFWQVWEQAGSFRAELGSPFCWVATIARRKAIDRLRATSRHLRRIQEAQDASVEHDFVPPVAVETIAAGERRGLVQTALAKLNSDERRVIALAFFDGLTHEEIAGALRMPIGTIKARIRRGLMKLEPAFARLRQASEV